MMDNKEKLSKESVLWYIQNNTRYLIVEDIDLIGIKIDNVLEHPAIYVTLYSKGNKPSTAKFNYNNYKKWVIKQRTDKLKRIKDNVTNK